MTFWRFFFFFFLRGLYKYCLRAGPGFYFNATFSASLSVLQYHFCAVCLRGISRSRCPRNCCANTDNAESYVCGLFSFRLALSIKRDLSNNLNLFHFSSPSPPPKTIEFCQPCLSCYRPTSDLAAGCSLPVSCRLR